MIDGARSNKSNSGWLKFCNLNFYVLTFITGLVFIFLIGCPQATAPTSTVNPDEVTVSNSSNALTIGFTAGDDSTGVRGQLTLPTVDSNGVTISWSSSHPDLIAPTGTVTRPTNVDVSVTLTATLSKGEVRRIKTFTVLVLRFDPDGDAVTGARAVLEITYVSGDNSSNVTTDLTLSTQGADGVAISWASSQPEVISTAGVVSRPSNENASVTLTATLTKNQAQSTKMFSLIVLVDRPPMLSNHTFSVAEDIGDTEVIGTVVATDAESSSLTYSITANDSDLFEINSAAGELSLADGQRLDYETTNKHIINVSVFDGNLTANADLTVNVTDVTTCPATIFATTGGSVALSEHISAGDGSSNSFYLIPLVDLEPNCPVSITFDLSTVTESDLYFRLTNMPFDSSYIFYVEWDFRDETPAIGSGTLQFDTNGSSMIDSTGDESISYRLAQGDSGIFTNSLIIVNSTPARTLNFQLGNPHIFTSQTITLTPQ